MRLVAAFVIALALALPAQAQLVRRADIARSAVTDFIRPETAAFATAAEALVPALETLCTTPDDTAFETARKAFADAAIAYGRIEFLTLGPLTESNRADRILFWPDRRGIGLRQVQALLAEEDASATELAGLQGKSVAVQGLGALEFLLFGTGAETLTGSAQSFRCLYGRAIAQNLSKIGTEIEAGWSDPEGIAHRLSEPDADYTDYRTTTEALESLVGLIAHGIEGLRDTRLNPVLGRDGAEANPRLALFWRSGQTMPMLGATVGAMERLVSISGVAVNTTLSDEIDDAFARATEAIAAVDAPIETALADPAQRAALDDLVAALSELQQLIGEDLAAQLGLSVGFSSLDGD
jgi:uncharacterized protein